MSETIDLTAQMAAFLAGGNAVTVLDYAGNAVGKHRDIDLSQERILALEPEKKTRGATPKNKHIISAPSLGLPREGSVRAKHFDPVEQDQAEPAPVRPTVKKIMPLVTHAVDTGIQATPPPAPPSSAVDASYLALPDPRPVDASYSLPIQSVVTAAAPVIDVLAELRKIRKAVADIGASVERFERISRRA